jgi:hypothetical protein
MDRTSRFERTLLTCERGSNNYVNKKVWDPTTALLLPTAMCSIPQTGSCSFGFVIVALTLLLLNANLTFDEKHHKTIVLFENSTTTPFLN